MQIIKKGFTIKSEVLDISSIKPAEGGKIEGREYPTSVKFRSLNLIEDKFENTFKETEEIIEYKIACASNGEAEKVTNLLRDFRSKQTPFYINSSIPKKYEGSQMFIATSFDNGATFISLNGNQKSKSST